MERYASTLGVGLCISFVTASRSAQTKLLKNPKKAAPIRNTLVFLIEPQTVQTGCPGPQVADETILRPSPQSLSGCVCALASPHVRAGRSQLSVCAGTSVLSRCSPEPTRAQEAS